MLKNAPTEATRSPATLLLSTALLVASSAAGCAADPADEGGIQTDVQTAAQLQGGSYFAEVNANGTGCPAGTWAADISDEGQTLRIWFNDYETRIEPWESIDVADCQLAIKLHSPQGLSFAVRSFRYAGYANLEPGAVGTHTAHYYFQGNPAAGESAQTDIHGPYNGVYRVEDTIATGDLVWSACGVERNLNITTRIRVRNGDSDARGYMNLARVRGDTDFVIGLSWKDC